jgi:hypothetical protein
VELRPAQAGLPAVDLTNRTEQTIVGFMILWMTGENTSYTGVTMEQLSPEQSWVRPGQTVTAAPSRLTSSEKVEIVLDAVRFDDGRFAGPGSQKRPLP